MPRIWIIAIFVLIQLYSFIEAAVTPAPRLMPRWAWVLVTGFVPVVGMLMWFFFGRPRGGTSGNRRPKGPDDDTDFLKSI